MNWCAERFGLNPFDVVRNLAVDPEMEVRCCTGSTEERQEALQTLNESQTIVLDMSAVSTLFILEKVELLRDWPGCVTLAQATVADIRRLIREKSSPTGEVGTLASIDGQYRFFETTDDQRTAYVKRLMHLVDFVEGHCRVAPSPGLLSLEPGRRDLLTKVIGQCSAEGITLAANPGHVLWTDDLVVASLAKNELGVRSVWTQVALQALMEKGLLSTAKFAEASAKLLGWGYSFTSINIDTLMSAGTQAAWKPDQQPLKAALEHFSRETVELAGLAQLVGNFLREIYRHGLLPERRDAVVIAVLDALARRIGGSSLIQNIRVALARLFGLDVIGSANANALILTWMRGRIVA